MTNVLDLLLNANPANLPEREYRLTRLSEASGGDVVFRLRALPYDRVAEIRQVDDVDQSMHILLAGVVAPDLRSQALMDKFGVVTPVDMIKEMLLPGEIDDLVIRIEQLSGYRTNVLEEVKKNSWTTPSSG